MSYEAAANQGSGRGAGPLRLALAVDQFPVLSETFVSSEVRALREAGHTVYVEAGRRPGHPDTRAAAGVPIAYLDEESRRRRLIDLVALVLRHPLRALGDVRSQRRWSREEEVRPLRRLAPAARRLRKRRVQHIHAHFAAGAALDAMRLGRVLGLPYSLITHGYDIFESPRNLAEKHVKAAFALSASEYSVRYLRERLGPQATARLHRQIMGVDPDRFVRRAPHPEDGVVLAVGRLVEKKGVAHLVEAAALLEGDPAFERLVIVGEGPLAADLERQASELGIADRVDFMGARTPAQVLEHLEAAGVVAIPSVVARSGDRDTMPVIAKEALAMEVPVVASDAVGLPEVVGPDWGRLVPPGDPVALAQALSELLRLPPAERAAVGRAGREFVVRCCNLYTETERLAKLIAAATA